MGNENSLRSLLNKFIELSIDKEELYLKVGRATEINTENCTFTFVPNDETAPVPRVLLKSIEGANGGALIIVPEENSFVIMGFTSPTSGAIIHVEVSQKIIITTAGTQLTTDEFIINADNTIFNGGEFGGLIKIEKLTADLNKLRDTVNDLISEFRGHVHGGVSSGGATTAQTTSTVNDADEFFRDSYENTKITH